MPLKWFRSHRVAAPAVRKMQRRLEHQAEDQDHQAAIPPIPLAGPRPAFHDRSGWIHAARTCRCCRYCRGGGAASISYQTKNRRRFTIHGLSYQHKHNEEAGWSCNSTPAGSPLPMYASTSPRHVHSRHFGFSSSRVPHGRSPRTEQMLPLTPDSHPSIIFIDCPP
ncbi:hypothetical protein GQ600_15800 [Phytophthora cactorum]|nr:hypothetical protein GQ600_15800 [Phytophthora cactorum]